MRKVKMMLNDNLNLDWQRTKKTTNVQQSRGNQLLVSYVLKKDQAPIFKTASTRCVWPQSLLTTDSRFLTRKLIVKAF